jgi:hypothetical protein
LLILVITLIGIPVTVFWDYQRLEMYKQWQAKFKMAQTFSFSGTDQAASLVSDPTYASNRTLETWAQSSIDIAYIVLSLQLSNRELPVWAVVSVVEHVGV